MLDRNKIVADVLVQEAISELTMRMAVTKPILIGGISSALVVLIIQAFLYFDSQLEEEELAKNKINLAETVASRTELRIQDAANIIEITATLPQVKNTAFANMISEEYKGIPENVDVEKRVIARSVLNENTNFQSIFFIMPNGDLYLVEPYSRQETVTLSNFAFRDYYKGVIETKNTYVSEVFKGATVDSITVVVIATPVYEDGQLAGIWGGALELNAIGERLKELELGENEVAVIVDHNGNEVTSTEPPVDQIRSYSHLESFGKAEGAAGTNIEKINGIDMFVTYAPIELGNTNWTVMLLQPYDEAFATVSLHRIEALAVISVVLAIMGVSSFFLSRSLIRNINLAKKVEGANDVLKSVNQELRRDKTTLELMSKELQTKNERLEHLAKELDLKAEELRQMDIAKEEFSAMITHELKTPLVPIVGYTELLADGTLGELTPMQKEKIQLMHDSAVSLSKLVTDLLDARKLELNKMKFDVIESPVKEIVEQSVTSFKPVSEAKKIDLVYVVEEPDGRLKVRCDPKRIQQVLNNLLSNAVKFVPENTGRIEVSAKPADLSVVFAVKDNGLGIPREKQDQIFKKFYQVDTSLRRETGGSGLGLAISKGIVEAHGGRIWFDSEPGSGSTFYFSIPMYSVNPEGGKK